MDKGSNEQQTESSNISDLPHPGNKSCELKVSDSSDEENNEQDEEPMKYTLPRHYGEELSLFIGRLNALYNFNLPEDISEIQPETLDFLYKNYDISTLQKVNKPHETVDTIVKGYGLRRPKEQTQLEEDDELLASVTQCSDRDMFNRVKAKNYNNVIDLAIKYPGGYDENNCAFVYKELLKNKSVIELKNEEAIEELTSENDSEITLTKSFIVPIEGQNNERLGKKLSITGKGKTMEKANHDCKLNLVHAVFNIGLIKEYCIEYGFYGKMTALYDDSMDNVAIELIDNSKAWDTFMGKLETVMKYKENHPEQKFVQKSQKKFFESPQLAKESSDFQRQQSKPRESTLLDEVEEYSWRNAGELFSEKFENFKLDDSIDLNAIDKEEQQKIFDTFAKVPTGTIVDLGPSTSAGPSTSQTSSTIHIPNLWDFTEEEDEPKRTVNKNPQSTSIFSHSDLFNRLIPTTSRANSPDTYEEFVDVDSINREEQARIYAEIQAKNRKFATSSEYLIAPPNTPSSSTMSQNIPYRFSARDIEMDKNGWHIDSKMIEEQRELLEKFEKSKNKK